MYVHHADDTRPHVRWHNDRTFPRHPAMRESQPVWDRGREMEEFGREAARCIFVWIQRYVPSAAELDLIRRDVDAAILFARNVVDPGHVAELSRTPKSATAGLL